MSRSINGRPTIGIRLIGVAFTAAMVGSCSAFGPSGDLPVGAVQIAAPPEFAAWFVRTEACAGISGHFQQIQWFVVPGAETFETREGRKVGMWEKNGSVTRIIVAGRFAQHEMVVRHEILHHLLDREGHPPEYFVGRCQLTWETWPSSPGDR